MSATRMVVCRLFVLGCALFLMAFAAEPAAPGKEKDSRQCRRHGRWEPGREIIFAKDSVARDLRPINEGRFIKAIFVI